MYPHFYEPNVWIFCASLTLMCDAIPRSEDMFPWKQGAGREMATPLKWTERLVFTSVNQVSGLYKHVKAVFKYIYIYMMWLSTTCIPLLSTVVIQAAAVTVMKYPWVMRMMKMASQHALLWLHFWPLNRRLRREEPHRFSWKQQER